MARKAKAVICRQLNGPVVVEQIELESPHRDEVMVKLGACGVCHSDLSAINGTIGMPLPLILGHEGAGTVVEVGEGVSSLAAGDTVAPVVVDRDDGHVDCLLAGPLVGRGLGAPVEHGPHRFPVLSSTRRVVMPFSEPTVFQLGIRNPSAVRKAGVPASARGMRRRRGRVRGLSPR